MRHEFLTTVLPLSLPLSRAPSGKPANVPVSIHWGSHLSADALARPTGSKREETSPAGAAVESVSLPGREGELELANGSGGLTAAAPLEKPGNHALALKLVQ